MARQLFLLLASAVYCLVGAEHAYNDGVAFKHAKYVVVEQWPPSDCFAGEAFNFQPMATIYDDETGAIAAGFQGEVYASIVESPTGYEALRMGNGTVHPAVETSTEVRGGLAQFSGLQIFEAGTYRLQYTARRRTPDGRLVETAVSSDGLPFEVRLAAPHALAFATHPGAATGGLLLRPQPVLAVVDAGGNTLPAVGGAFGGWVNARLAAPAGRKAGNASTPAAHASGRAANFNPSEVSLIFRPRRGKPAPRALLLGAAARRSC